VLFFSNPHLSNCFSLNLSNMIAFTATHLQPSLTMEFILSYAQNVLVEGVPFLDFERWFLPTLPSICRHTNIIHIFQDRGKQFIMHYVWTHCTIHPWGHHLPVQCGCCGCIRSWVSVNGPDSSCLFACNGCSKKLKFSPPPGIKWLGGEVAGGWWMIVGQED
jgi:hypothetical protein